MKGRLRSDCIRCASRAGRIERVKLAEVSSCCVVSGGLPCLIIARQRLAKPYTRQHFEGGILDKICKCQRMQWQACEPRNVVIRDRLCVQTVTAVSSREQCPGRPPSRTGTTGSYDLRLDDQRSLNLRHYNKAMRCLFSISSFNPCTNTSRGRVGSTCYNCPLY